MASRVNLLVNRVLGLDGLEPGALFRTYENGTTTPLSCYADNALAVEYSQPVEADEYGTLPPIYLATAAPYRILLTDADGAPLPGYPMDDMSPESVTAGAASIPFTPTETLPYTNVQAAIEGAAALSSDQTALADRALMPWVTAGSGDAFTVTPNPVVTGYGTFLALRVRFDRRNTGAATINVNGLGAQPLRKMARDGNPAALAAGDVQPGDIRDVTWDGAQFVIATPLPTGASGYIRHPSGVQECWETINLAFFSTLAVRATWTFPVAFIAAPVVSATMPFGAANYTGVDSRGVFPQVSPVTASADVYALTASGTAALADTAAIANVRVRAVGRWF